MKNAKVLSKSEQKNIVSMMQHHARHISDKLAFLYLQDGETETIKATFKELDQRARLVAAYLQKNKCEGNTVLLLYPAGLEFVAALLGCFYANVTAVPVNCPPQAEFEKHTSNIIATANDAAITGILTSTEYADLVSKHCQSLLANQVSLLATTYDFAQLQVRDYKPKKLKHTALAYLQYTSGSTSAPKGVMITHSNLTASLVHTANAWHYNDNSITLNWASPAHVYGLICGLLVPLYQGTTAIVFPAAEFIKKPVRWLRLISNYKVTHSGCPNFGYDLCVQQIKSADCKGLNLHTWKCAVNGGEPVNEVTLQQFTNQFSRFGFNSNSFALSYGMSEATGLIACKKYLTNSVKQKVSKNSTLRDILSLGKTLPNLKVASIDPETKHTLNDGEVGEICLSGSSIAAGYWQKPVETSETFYTLLENTQGNYFRTGDLGYIKNGEIFLTGRLKDLLIIYGKKYYPLDLEFACRAANKNLVEKNSCIAFSVSINAKEEIIIAQEITEASNQKTFEKICKSIRQALAKNFQLDAYGVVLTPPNSLPRTNSGKLQRQICKNQYLNNELSIVYSHFKQSPVRDFSQQISQDKIKQKHKLTVAQLIKTDLVTQVANILRLPIDDIELDSELSEYGLDSINIVQLTNYFNEKYQLNFTPAIFFEYKTLADFCDFIIDNYQNTFSNAETIVSQNAQSNATNNLNKVTVNASHESYDDNDIAIIGMSGCFPGANNIEQFWQLLEKEQDAISEIPADRWNWQDYYGDKTDNQKKTKIKRGGFIKDVDKFDAEFFNISRHEAELMDPQQRLFLQTVWKTIEDAGYVPGSLKGSKTGIFVGVSTSDYMELLQKHNHAEAHSITGTVFSVLPNRISYLLDLHGPSEAIDTACSSSLVAIHNAVRSIQYGDCDMAIAGGVNLLLTPRLFLAFDQAGMLSLDGHCKTFDETANGYARGEGVGAILLKPLKKALADNDHVYAVIKATAINHGGHVKSLTVPNPNAQAELIIDAVTKANISIDSISYLEAHGTGTALGDPIEINGLKKAFAALSKKQNSQPAKIPYCGIGAVKTNIGHLEAAAGIAGIIKVLLAIQHKKLPASLHINKLNPYIDFDDSPFYVVDKTQDWIKLSDVNNNLMPYRAGVSSFGFGGVNSHVVIEEPPKVAISSAENSKPYYLVTLSAKNQSSLEQKILDLQAWLNQYANTISLQQISYTLNTGRDHFERRVAIIANSLEALQVSLQHAINKQLDDNCILQDTTLSENTLTQDELINAYNKIQNYSKSSPNDYLVYLKIIAKFYVNLNVIDWQLIHHKEINQKISLPSYPFIGKTYWMLPLVSGSQSADNSIADEYYVNFNLENVSNAEKILFKAIILGKHFYIKDHIFLKKAILPGVAYLELARAAAALAYPDKVINKLKNIVWLYPIIANSNEHELIVFIHFYYKNNILLFDIYTNENNKIILHAQGELDYLMSELPKLDKLNLSEIRKQMSHSYIKQDIYENFLPKFAVAFEYGPSFRLIEALHTNQHELLAEITLSANQNAQLNFVLHPSLFDASIQALVGFMDAAISERDLDKIAMPFSLKQLHIYKPLTNSYYMYAELVKRSPTNSKNIIINLYLFNESGDVLVKADGFCMRQADNSLKLFETDNLNSVRLQDMYLYQFLWQNQAHATTLPVISKQTTKSAYALVFTNDEQSFNTIFDRLMTSNITSIQISFSTAYRVIDSAKHYVINANQYMDYQSLIHNLQQVGITPSTIVYWHSNKLNITSDLDTLLKHGVYSVFLLTQALMQAKLATDIRLLYCYSKDDSAPAQTMINGFAKTLLQENPRFCYHCVEIPQTITTHNFTEILQLELANFSNKVPLMVRYEQGQRQVKIAKPVQLNNSYTKLLLTQEDVCLITGGMGKIGLVIARYLAMNVKAKLILIGRSALNPAIDLELKKLRALTPVVEYMQADITDQDNVKDLIAIIKTRYQHINAIFHCAGIAKDSIVLKKELVNFTEVVAPKVNGTYFLDAYTKKEPIKYFILFASAAGVLGNIGQSDYASANVFMDQFATWRNEQVKLGKCNGQAISIDWPLWEEGGLQIDEKTKVWMKDVKGILPLSTETALKAFEAILTTQLDQVAVVTGDVNKINHLFSLSYPLLIQHEQINSPTINSSVAIHGIIDHLKLVSAELLKASPETLDIDKNLSVYGLDSIIMLNMLSVLDKKYNIALLPTAFSDYPTIRTFAEHILQEINSSILPAQEIPQQSTINANIANTVNSNYKVIEQSAYITTSGKPTINVTNRKIAIISAACRYPQSPNIEAYWDNLVNARRMIQTGIPAERWNHALYYSPDKNIPFKTYANWAGLISDIDLFDADYFGVSEHDAYALDPQHRIMLELAQELFDRAGYTREEISGKPISVIVGGGESHYGKKFFTDIPAKAEPHIIVNRIGNMIASRLCDFYNLTAYSHTLDAACSASLLAIHHACNSILTGDAEMAIAGGAELLLDPEAFIGFSKAGTLSDDGFCYVFDERAKGFVMAEGFGLILLKDYDAAVRDGDRIMATILATATNNDGRTVGITTPNGKAQKQVIEKALQRADISAETITYLEAHGTGTLLGDPIEIKAASEVYANYTSAKNYCAVASVKSNMGHSLRAAGVASVIKVALALQNKYIPATLHCEKPHPRFQFDKSPFYPNTKGQSWAASSRHPRRAAASAFGFGGTNVHAILEEYQFPEGAKVRPALPPTKFNRRSYWLGNLKSEYKEIIKNLTLGGIDRKLAAELLRQKMSER